MDASIRPLISCTSLPGDHPAEKKLFMSEDCRLIMCIKPMVVDKHPFYYIYIIIIIIMSSRQHGYS